MTRFLGIDRLDYSEWPHRCGAGTPRGGRWGPPLREPELSFRSRLSAEIELDQRRWRDLCLSVQAALRLLESGPPSSTSVFSRPNCPRAMRAANAGETDIMQRIVRNVVREDVIPNILRGPVGNRIDLHQLEFRVPFNLACARTRRSLIAADGRDPCGQTREFFLEGTNFSQRAAVIRLHRP